MFCVRKQINGIFLSVLVLGLIFSSCRRKPPGTSQSPTTETASDSSQVTLQFSLRVNKNTYLYTDYGEPPQLAVWLEYPNGKFYKTVFVTHRTGANDWAGKVDCPVALPIWESRQFGQLPPTQRPDFLAAVTGATPQGGPFQVKIRVPRGSRWRYFVEVNASGDFNAAFPYWLKNGTPDDVGNGQPSLVYSGDILAEPGKAGSPKLLGFTAQLTPVDTLRTDWDKMTTARALISDIRVKVLTK